MKKLFTIIALLTSLTFGVKSQTLKKSDIIRLESKAFKNFKHKNYSESLLMFKKLDYITNNEYDYYDYMIGLCLLSTDIDDHKIEAIQYLENYKDNIQKHHVNNTIDYNLDRAYTHTSFTIDYYLGRAYHFNKRYDEAKVYLYKYVKRLESSKIVFGVNDYSNNVHSEKNTTDVYKYIIDCEKKTMFFNDDQIFLIAGE